jgi:hypothetical protein
VGSGVRLYGADTCSVVASWDNRVLQQLVRARLVPWVPACSNFDRSLLGGSEQDFLPFAKGFKARGSGMAVDWDAGVASVAGFTPAKMSIELRGIAGAEHLLIIPALPS